MRKNYVKPLCLDITNGLLCQQCSNTCASWMNTSTGTTGWIPTENGYYIVASGMSDNDHKQFAVTAGTMYRFTQDGKWAPCPERNCQCEWESNTSCEVEYYNKDTETWEKVSFSSMGS